MEDLFCSTNKCKRKAKYYNSLENSYYCSGCVHSIFNPKDCEKLGSVTAIKQLIRLSNSLLEKIRMYIMEEQLEFKWVQVLEQLKVFDAELGEIKHNIENTLKEKKLKDLDKIQQRSFDLRFRITESEGYKKYLFHKDMNENRLQDEKKELNLTVTQIVNDMTEIRLDEEKTAIKERVQNWRDLFEPKSSTSIEIEKLKMTHLNELKSIKKQQLADKELYEKEKEDLLAQRIEIEQELNTLKNQPKENSEVSQSISYDV